MDDVMVMESDEAPALFLFYSNNALLLYTKGLLPYVVFQRSYLSLLSQAQKGYEPDRRRLVGTWGHYFVPKRFYAKISALSMCTRLFNTLHFFKHVICERHDLHEVRTNSRNISLIFQVSKHI